VLISLVNECFGNAIMWKMETKSKYNKTVTTVVNTNTDNCLTSCRG